MNMSAIKLLNRELSILEFNKRVLAMSMREDVPLLERLRYVCIVSSNLDEFFEIRFPDVQPEALRLLGAAQAARTLKQVCDCAQELVHQQYDIYNQVLIPALAAQSVVLLSHAQRNDRQRKWVSDFFHREVKPLLTPIALDPVHPFPMVANKSLNFIVKLAGKDAFGRENPIAIVKVPRVLARVIQLPANISDGKQAFVMLSSVIRAHLHELFPGRETERFSQFRVTRDSDLLVDEQEVGNLRQAMRLGLTQRHFGNAVRLEVSRQCPDDLAELLLRQFNIDQDVLFRVDGPVNLVRLTQLIDMVSSKTLRFAPFTPSWPKALPANASYFDALHQHDVLMHHPFESFDPVIGLLKEAVADPRVLAIKQTIYRAGTDSALMELLVEGARRGKEVTAVVELKARFDEEANINWADQLESVGAQVVYGVVGLKTHAKMLLITRREGSKLKRYAHLSTGNYNPRTARLYTDLGYMTANTELTADVDHVFQHLASQSKVQPLKHLWLAPFSMHRHFVEWINKTAAAAKSHPRQVRIVAKMNALTDESLIEALIAAGKAGVKIDLIVRGACMLPPGVKGHTDNIRIRSVVGRFLEHSRVFYFRAGKDEALYLASADWMGRNMFRRIEIAWPILDKALRQRIVDECLTPYLHDGTDAWLAQPDGSYTVSDGSSPSAQRALMALHGSAT
jgi:polyphosphate kinase